MVLLSSAAYLQSQPSVLYIFFSPIYIEIVFFGSCGSEGRAVNGVAVLLRWGKKISVGCVSLFPLSLLFVVEEEREGARGVWRSSIFGGAGGNGFFDCSGDGGGGGGVGSRGWGD